MLRGSSTFRSAFFLGFREALPLLGGYVPVAISFGLIAVQSGFTVWESLAISLFIYAGASQFLFVGMYAAGAPLWLVAAMALVINARHLVYAPNLAKSLSPERGWVVAMHGLTDQIYAIADVRLPLLDEEKRLPWYLGAALLAWFSWVFSTALGAVVGESLVTRWPLLHQSMPFALVALFLVLLAPRFTDRAWGLGLMVATVAALGMTLGGYTNLAIPLAALLGALAYMLLRGTVSTEVQ